MRLSVENPKYLGRTLGQDPNDHGLVSLDEKKEMIKYIYKAWNGLTKSIHRQIE